MFWFFDRLINVDIVPNWPNTLPSPACEIQWAKILDWVCPDETRLVSDHCCRFWHGSCGLGWSSGEKFEPRRLKSKALHLADLPKSANFPGISFGSYISWNKKIRPLQQDKRKDMSTTCIAWNKGGQPVAELKVPELYAAKRSCLLMPHEKTCNCGNSRFLLPRMKKK